MIPSTETSIDTSRTCVLIGLYSGSFRASNSSTFRRQRASSRKQAELFSFLVEGSGLSDLTRYFDIQAKWDSRKYSLVTEDDMIFRHQATKRFNGEIFRTLFRLWSRNQLPKDFRAESTTTRTNTQKVLFRAVTVPGQEAVFGDSSKRWGDGWQIRSASGAASVPKSPTAQPQILERTADA